MAPPHPAATSLRSRILGDQRRQFNAAPSAEPTRPFSGRGVGLRVLPPDGLPRVLQLEAVQHRRRSSQQEQTFLTPVTLS